MLWKFWQRDWELIDKTEMPSAFEQIANSKYKMDGFKTENMFAAFRKKTVLVFKCNLTNKIKIVTETNP